MKLGIADRIVLLNLLPAEGNIITLRVVNELRSELSFSEEELKEAKIVTEAGPEGQGRTNWDGSANVEKDVKIGDTAKGIIVAALKKLNDEEKLTAQFVPMYEAFVE